MLRNNNVFSRRVSTCFSFFFWRFRYMEVLDDAIMYVDVVFWTSGFNTLLIIIVVLIEVEFFTFHWNLVIYYYLSIPQLSPTLIVLLKLHLHLFFMFIYTDDLFLNLFRVFDVVIDFLFLFFINLFCFFKFVIDFLLLYFLNLFWFF